MIDNVTLTFCPKTREDYTLYNSILSNYKYMRNLVIESIDTYVKLLIFTEKKFIQIKVFHIKEFLNLNEVTNGDYIRFVSQLNNHIKPLNISLDNFILTRIDLKVDLKLSEAEMQEYLYIFSKLRQKYYSLKKKVYYNEDNSNIESVYYKGSRFNINVYDKQNQLKKKGIDNPTYKNVFRLELQIKSKELSAYCKRFGTSKELINFWDIAVRDYFFNNLLIEKFLYNGDYYNQNNINFKLEDIKLSTQQKLLEFCRNIAETDITEASKKLSRGTASKYIKELTEREINPVMIKRFDYLAGLKTIIEEKSRAV